MPEAAKVEVFTVAPDRRHAALRDVLAMRLGLESSLVDLRFDASGKPYVAGGPPFSLSDSGEFAVIAVGENAPVGVDVERVKPGRPFGRLAQRFSQHERELLSPLSGKQLVEAFYLLWTAKEAYLKALGAGLSKPLDSFDISIAAPPDAAEPVLLADRDASGERRPWTLRRLAMPQGYVATVAVAAVSCEIHQRSFEPAPAA